MEETLKLRQPLPNKQNNDKRRVQRRTNPVRALRRRCRKYGLLHKKGQAIGLHYPIRL